MGVLRVSHDLPSRRIFFFFFFFFPPFFPTPVLWFPRSMRKLDVETTLLGGIKFVEKETGEKTIEKNKKFSFSTFEMDN